MSSKLYLTFDDRYIDLWHGYSQGLIELGVRATFFVSEIEAIESSEIDKLLEMQEMGHEIGCHSLYHLHPHEFLEVLTIRDYMQYEVVPSLRQMKAYGFKVDSWAYPFNAYTPHLAKEIAKHFRVQRTRTDNFLLEPSSEIPNFEGSFHSQSFSLKDILSLKTDNFPVPCFNSSHQSAIVYTESKSYGIEDLVYVNMMQLENVTVAHNFHENSYIDRIKNTYNTGWQYTPTYNLKSFIDLFSKNRADVVICSCSQENIEQFVRDWLEWPWRSARKALVLSVSSKVLQLFNLKEYFQPELIVPRLKDLYGFSVKDYKVYFKNMEDRVSFWIVLQKGGDQGEKS